MPETRSVIFVCMGNICRSPAGEGVLQKLVEDRGLRERIAIDSAGTIGYHTGNPADERMSEAASRRGYDLTSRARQVTADDLERFDLVVAMDRENLRDLERMAGGPRDHIRMLGSFLEACGNGEARSVPDPYYGGAAGFEHVLDMIEEACPAIVATLLDDDV